MRPFKIEVHGMLVLSLAGAMIFSSCQKTLNDETARMLPESKTSLSKDQGHLRQTKTFSSDVILRWMNMQLDMLRVPLPAGTGTQSPDRCGAYAGIAAYEAVVNGMTAYQSLYGQLKDFPQMPKTEPGKAYHWAASANAALASVNRGLFPSTAAANKTAMNALESQLESLYATETDAATLQRSIAYGREVAKRVLTWAATDGSANVNPTYVAPVGFGLWMPTSPPPAAAVNPYANQRRLLTPHVADGTSMPPPVYSETPGSPFWNMVKHVYDVSFITTADQKAAAIYHRDAPGYPGGGHFISIYKQALEKAGLNLADGALGYAKFGITISDATNICFTEKYKHLVVRPVTYIRNVMGHTSWSTLIPVPNHPEFPSGHATINSAVMEALTNIFGSNFQLTLHTYDYLGLAPRSYNSFYEMSKEMSDSRVWGGLHYQETQDKSMMQGKKIGQNVLSTVKFLKD